MKHTHFLIDITEHLEDKTMKDYLNIQNDFAKFLVERGYFSFEKSINEVVKQFLEIDIDLTDASAGSKRSPNYIFLCKKDSNFIFIDIESTQKTFT